MSCVILKSSLDGTFACSGESVVYSCEVHSAIAVQFSSDHFDADPIRFTRTDEILFSATRGPFQAILTDVNSIDVFTANFSAQLSVAVTMDLNGSVIECSGGGEAKNTTLLVSGESIIIATSYCIGYCCMLLDFYLVQVSCSRLSVGRTS